MKALIAPICLLAIASSSFAADPRPGAFEEVAGEYYHGDGTGVNCTIKLSAAGKFDYEWRGCLGTYDKNEGGFTLKNGGITITPERPNIREGFRGTPTEFFSVVWGSRKYLVPTNDMVEFCSAVNDGTEPRDGNWSHYDLRRNDWGKAVTGRPAVPEPWTKYFLNKPVRGKIMELLGKQEAWLDLGAGHGILPGMILTARDHGKVMFSQVRVEAVEKARCRIKCQWNDSKLAVGQTVSSRFHE
jgi:hypothetical protein